MVARWLYLAFPLLLLAHMHEEYWTGFTQKFPPPRLRGSLADRGFWVLTPLLMSATAAIGVAYLLEAPGIHFWAVLAVSTIFLWNSAVHAAWSAISREYQPGLITGLLYAPVAILWLWLAVTRDGLPWSVVWPALLAGLAIMLALVGLAVVGRRVLR